MPVPTARGDTTGIGPPHAPDAARRARLISAMALAAVVGVGLWVVMTANRSRAVAKPTRAVRLLTMERPFPPEGRYPSDPYIGPHACAECHPAESAIHARSGHAQTLSAASRRKIASRLDGTTVTDPEYPEVLWSYAYRDGQLHIARKAKDKKVEECVAEYAFGSGHHATTFVSLIDPWIPSILEHRITYYTKQHALGLTPGHNSQPPPPGLTPLGGLVPPQDARKCFGCHTTQTSARPPRQIDEQTMIPNVSCERCHGPGRAHVMAARRGAPAAELELPFGPDRYTADSLLILCGTCHRHPSRSRPGQIRPDDPHLARFQPVGILESRCFRESNGAFSCVTCHDPHARASTDRASYLSVCASCHSGGAAPPAASAVAGNPCPVEPRGDCVNCHMPRVEAGQNVLFADHWIRVRRPGESRLPLQGPPANLRLLDTPEP